MLHAVNSTVFYNTGARICFIKIIGACNKLRPGETKGGNEMMDICMIGIIIVSCALMKLLIDWCESQVGPGERK